MAQGGAPNKTAPGCGPSVEVLASPEATNTSINSYYPVMVADHVLLTKDNEGIQIAKKRVDAEASMKAKSGQAPKL